MVELVCSMCGGRRGRRVARWTRQALVRCARCGLVHLLPRPVSRADDTGQLHSLSQYDDINAGLAAGHAVHRERLLASLLVKMPPPARVLEVGSADGKLLHLCAARGYTCTGIEPAADDRDAVDDRDAADDRDAVNDRGDGGINSDGAGGGGGAGVAVIRASFEDAALPAEAFDAAVLVQVLEHFLDPRAALAKLFAVLRPGGVVYVETPNFNAASRRLRRRGWASMNIGPGHWHLFDAESLAFAAEHTGFRVDGVGTFFKGLSAGRGSKRFAVDLLSKAGAPLSLGNNLAAWLRRPG